MGLKCEGVGKVSNRIAKIYSDRTDIFADTNQFIAHHQRLAPPRSIMRQRADTIAKKNSGMKAANGWLHGLEVPLEYVEALFEYIPQIIGFIVFRIAPLVILGYIIWCAWAHRCHILNCSKIEESIKTSNNISNQLSNQISNKKVGGSGSLPPPRLNKNFYEAAPQTSNTPLLPNPTTINIHNNNISSQVV
jgi:hypothetical protein